MTRLTAVEGEGFVNHVFVLDTNAEPVVVRFAIDPLRRDDFDIEEWCLINAPGVGIPVPALLARGGLDGVSYIIQSFVDGRSGDTLPPETAWSRLGSYAAHLRRMPLTPESPDDLFSRFGRDLDAAWRAHLEYNVQALGIQALGTEDPLIDLGVYPAERQPILRLALTELLATEFEFGLCHGDLAPRNLLVPDGGDPVLIDWGAAFTGPAPWGDLETVYAWHITENALSYADVERFAEACGIPLGENVPTLEAMMLLRHLDLVRWCLDVRPDLLPEYREAARVGVRRFLEIYAPPRV